ncbi:MAG: hypothetical protein A2Y48_07865 [Nitrospirae bacterium RIFCSPLOW2_12_42_9]|nr:MAG: hypothetical protein A2Y48_07865 [Nitrospirae bacterium RIFCSPLOW2_12_42_9]
MGIFKGSEDLITNLKQGIDELSSLETDDHILNHALNLILSLSGYPEGLKGEDIPLSARIVSLADTYDALVSDRSYRQGFTHEEALEIIKKEEGKYDPRIFQVFLDNHLEFKRIKEKNSATA